MITKYAIEIFSGQAVFVQKCETEGDPVQDAMERVKQMKFSPESVSVNRQAYRKEGGLKKNVLYVWIGEKIA